MRPTARPLSFDLNSRITGPIPPITSRPDLLNDLTSLLSDLLTREELGQVFFKDRALEVHP